MKLLIFIMIIVSFVVAAEDPKNDFSTNPTCPKFTCEEQLEIIGQKKKGIDEILTAMNETKPQLCFQHSEDDPVSHIRILKCQNTNEKCMVDRGDYSWISSELQFTPIAKRKSNKNKSQVYGKINSKFCKTVEDSITDRLNGRSCDNSYQCKSSVCDEETKSCKGREKGSTCSDHTECDLGLACRPSTKWPFPTQCLALADVGSECQSEYDCKPRNFCWRIEIGKKKVCLEKNSAPDNIQIVWDLEKYPEVNTQSIYAHGTYCQSGLAFKTGKMAQCVSIKEDQIGISNNEDLKTIITTNHINKPIEDKIFDSTTLKCVPDGKTFCHYAKNKAVKFTLPCECGLYQEDLKEKEKAEDPKIESVWRDVGYCPIPKAEIIKNATVWIRKMNIQDNCHTLDRANFIAQRECGIALNLGILEAATISYFNMIYYPYIQKPEIKKCMERFVPDTWVNIQSGATFIQTGIASLILLGYYL